MRKRGHPPLNKNSAAATKLLQQANGPLEGMRGGEGRGGEPPLVAGDESTSTAQLMAKNYRLAKELVCELIDFHVNVEGIVVKYLIVSLPFAFYRAKYESGTVKRVKMSRD
jgi:hypothetical protein